MAKKRKKYKGQRLTDEAVTRLSEKLGAKPRMRIISPNGTTQVIDFNPELLQYVDTGEQTKTEERKGNMLLLSYFAVSAYIGAKIQKSAGKIKAAIQLSKEVVVDTFEQCLVISEQFTNKLAAALVAKVNPQMSFDF